MILHLENEAAEQRDASRSTLKPCITVKYKNSQTQLNFGNYCNVIFYCMLWGHLQGCIFVKILREVYNTLFSKYFCKFRYLINGLVGLKHVVYYDSK